MQVLRDVDIEFPCDSQDYDQCLFDYAVEHGYVLVTGNIKHFEPKYFEYAEDHETPGIVFITPPHIKNAYLIAEWLELIATENMKNRIVRI